MAKPTRLSRSADDERIGSSGVTVDIAPARSATTPASRAARSRETARFCNRYLFFAQDLSSSFSISEWISRAASRGARSAVIAGITDKATFRRRARSALTQATTLTHFRRRSSLSGSGSHSRCHKREQKALCPPLRSRLSRVSLAGNVVRYTLVDSPVDIVDANALQGWDWGYHLFTRSPKFRACTILRFNDSVILIDDLNQSKSRHRIAPFPQVCAVIQIYSRPNPCCHYRLYMMTTTTLSDGRRTRPRFTAPRPTQIPNSN